MLSGAVSTCAILVYGAQARNANTSTRWNHQQPRCAVCIASTESSAFDPLATRKPIGDQWPHGSSVTAMRQPSTRKPVTHDGEDRDQDEGRLLGVDQRARPLHPAPPSREPDADQHQRAEDVDDERLEVEVELALHDAQLEVLVDHHHDGRDGEDHEAGVEHQVEGAGVGLPRGAALRQACLSTRRDALGGTVEARQRLARAPQPDLAIEAVAGDQRRRHQQRVHHPDVGDVPEDFARCLAVFTSAVRPASR